MDQLAERIASLSDEQRVFLFDRIRKEKTPDKFGSLIRRHPTQETTPLSFAQERLWFLNRLEPESVFYNISAAFRLTGRLDRSALERAFGEIVLRHQVLRTIFVTVEGEPRQFVVPNVDLKVPLIDFSDLPEPDRSNEVRRQIGAEAKKPFNLTEGPLIRIRLLYLGESGENGEIEHVLVLTVHHIAFDGWSIALLIQEFAALYEGLQVEPTYLTLPTLPVQYADYAIWQRDWLQGNVLEQQLAYWRDRLKDAPTQLELPVDRPRLGVQTYRGAGYVFSISRELTEQLHGLCRSHRVTLFMGLLAAFQTLLRCYSGQDDFCIGAPVANRTRVELEKLIGFFVNTLVLRADLSGNPTVTELLARVRKTCLDAHAHQDLPFEKLVEALQPERTMSHNPLFQVMFALQNAPAREIEIADLRVSRLETDTGSTQFDLILEITEMEGGLEGRFQYSTDLFDGKRIERMAEHFETLLEGIVSAPDQRVSELPLLRPSERDQLIDWNATRVEYPRDQCIHQLFEAQAERTPEALAVVFEDRRLTYRELNASANQLAHYLRRLGVGPDAVVGLCVERSLEMVIGILGILKAGGAYLPLDPAYPRERLAFMLEDTKPVVVLTQATRRELLPEHLRVICLDSDWTVIGGERDQNLPNRTEARNLAYVIYTSGSTGKPKGVLVTHRGVVRLVKNTDYFNAGPKDVFLQFAPLAFDASTFEIWGALLNGATLALSPGSDFDALERLRATIQRHRVTTVWLTAALFHQVVDQQPESLDGVRQLLAGGDVLSVPHLRKFCQIFPDCTLTNGYGPTENTTFSTSERICATELAMRAPIGRPIPNSVAYVLDKDMNLVPTGVPGELYVGGDGLARGYLNQPQLTAWRFVPNPFSTDPGTRLYRTGDLAYWRTDGTLEYLGRIDHQVKIRGFRIELGEIEARLLEYPAVDAAAVVDREDTPGDKRLVAYVVARDGEAPTLDTLRDHLKAVLPDYMVPAAFVFLPALPVTANGKLDRKALPAPDVTVQMSHGYVPPRNATEETLAAIWAEVLGVKRVGIHDNFFELGGHSLSATRLLFKIAQAFGTQIGISSLFDKPILEEQARMLNQANLSHIGKHLEVDFIEDAQLDSEIFPNSPFMGNSSNPSAILLTGATGFLGAFLLYEYLRQTQSRIYCLVRSSSTESAYKKVERNLRHYRLWDPDFAERIFPICGDLSKPLLKMPESLWFQLAEEVDMVCHNGACVNFLQPYSILRATNVLGTQELLRLACLARTKPFHYISTSGVFDNQPNFEGHAYTETDLLPNTRIPMGGYSQSKKVAEQLVRNAGLRGVPTTIYRPSLIIGDASAGTCNTEDFFFRMLRGYLSLGKAPMRDFALDLVTVDYVSQAIVWLSRTGVDDVNTFHLTNPVHTSMNTLIEWTRVMGYLIDKVSETEWRSELYNAVNSNEDHPLFSLYSLLDQTHDSQSAGGVYSPRLESQYTRRRLAEGGIDCPVITEEIWRKNLLWIEQANLMPTKISV